MREQSAEPYIAAEACQRLDTAASAGKGVAQTAKDQAAEVAAETRQQAASLLDTVRAEVGQQAGVQQQRIAEAIRSLSKELGSMASSSPESGVLTNMAHEAARRGGEIAHWLEVREPVDVMDATRAYAQGRPAIFLALCGVAGALAGRLTRGAAATGTDTGSAAPGRPDINDVGRPVHQGPPEGELSGARIAETSRAVAYGEPAVAPIDPRGKGPFDPGGDPLR